MTYLKIIFYGLLASIERHPYLFVMILLLAIFAPFVFKWVLWVVLALVLLFVIGMAAFALRMRKMQNQMNEQFRNSAGAGFNAGTGFGGFSHFASSNMSLEELVRQMQAEADARQQKSSPNVSKEKKIENDKSGDYVDFEEVK